MPTNILHVTCAAENGLNETADDIECVLLNPDAADRLLDRENHMSKEDKQFPLDSRDNCCLYLCRIISSCELCMDRLKKYNQQTNDILSKYQPKESIPIDDYETIADQTSNIICYLANLLGDAQTSSISYFKYRKLIEKRIKNKLLDIPLAPMPEEVQQLLTEFNKRRNWLNHIPESLLIAELELIRTHKFDLPTDPVTITHYKSVTYEYFQDLLNSNKSFYEEARKVIQAAKKDYSLLMGRTILYPRRYSDSPVGIAKLEAARKSAEVQGLKH